jgi:hypothetical protein
MFSGMILKFFLHKPKLLEGYKLLLTYKLGFPSIIPFQCGFCCGDLLMTPRRYPYFDVVVGLVWSHDPESYADDSVSYWQGLPCQTGQG